MPHPFASLIDTVSSLHGWPLYLTVCLIAFGEAAAFIGVVLPGETAVFLGGALAATGRLDLPVILASVILAAVAGDSVGYQVGRWFGPAMRRSRPGGWIGEARWDRAEASMRRGGWWTVALGRWVALLRALVPAVAGASAMPYRRFLVANAVGGTLWASTVVMLGYGAGAAWQQASGRLLVVSLVAGGAVVAVATVQVRRARRHRPSAVEGRLPHPPSAARR